MIKRLHKTLFLCLLLFIGYSCQAQVKSSHVQSIDGKKFYVHTIEKSQSIYAISKLYGVSLEEIFLYNPEVRSGTKVGQEIRIPLVTQTVTTTTLVPAIDTSKYLTHKVAKSETIYFITRKYYLTERQLLDYNPAVTQTGLKEGQTIIVGEKKRRAPVIAKENKSTPPSTLVPIKETSTISLLPDSAMLKLVAKPKKISYNIGLILPFRFDQTLALDVNELAKTNSSFPAVPALAIDFYLGFKHAVDSLTSKDFKINLIAYDGDDKDSLRFNKIINDPTFKDLDMIFGPFYENGFKTIARKAKESCIPIISPITRQNKILYNNIYVSKTNPSQFTLIESLADYCIDSLVNSNANIILMAAAEKDKKEITYVNSFKNYYNERQKLLGKLPKDTVTVAKGMAGLKAVYKPDVKNIIVSLSYNQVFIADFTTQLALFAAKKDIVLCGWESTSEMDNIDQEYLNQLGYTFPHQFNITNLEAYNGLTKKYLNELGTYPDEYYFVGFDVGFYYLKNLMSIGPDFIHKLDQLPFETNYIRFKYTRPDNMTGFDNRGVYVFRYRDYKLQKTGWK
jgi:LysM repeat protein